MNSPIKRRYSSPLREEGARRTGELILAAAQDLFIAQGYVQTTIDQIAERGGAPGRPCSPTRAASGSCSSGSGTWPWPATTSPSRDPADLVPGSAHRARPGQIGAAARQEHEPHVPAVRAAGRGRPPRGGTDPDLGDFWQTAETQRRFGAQAFVEALTDKGPLKPGLDQESAIDMLWVVRATNPYRRLVAERAGRQNATRSGSATRCATCCPAPHKVRGGRG